MNVQIKVCERCGRQLKPIEEAPGWIQFSSLMSDIRLTVAPKGKSKEVVLNGNWNFDFCSIKCLTAVLKGLPLG